MRKGVTMNGEREKGLKRIVMRENLGEICSITFAGGCDERSR